MASKTQTVTVYNIADAARRLNVSRWTIARAIENGELEATRTGTRGVVIFADDLLDYALRIRDGKRPYVRRTPAEA